MTPPPPPPMSEMLQNSGMEFLDAADAWLRPLHKLRSCMAEICRVSCMGPCQAAARPELPLTLHRCWKWPSRRWGVGIVLVDMLIVLGYHVSFGALR
eukprot:CAMPEP_0202878244 /NCGR_PEP_ID=MMETSP1391-20130828/31900_1 /ASSEMBLY_ACC=CAM_ASM_000867 /TAXON_ID=1034604 /ORGANISM="Chlamydomonas leiostraca, Strain SAG 11-49" /LENGTH=96 /DNA_ID=CAMNT_0049560405 /DNA_START=486 /DNA_END=775 /DNA_ORIENTATION=+